jgi:DNA repair protein RAD5
LESVFDQTLRTSFLQKREDDGLPGECPICRHGPITEANLLEVIKKRRTNIANVVEEASNDSKQSRSLMVNLRRTDGFKTSSKLDALLRHLKQDLDESAAVGRPIKSVVFSQFTTFLDLIEVAMNLESMTFVRLDGTQSQAQREKALKEFRDGDTLVMLISLRAGGVGLNLTCASRVYMMV